MGKQRVELVFKVYKPLLTRKTPWGLEAPCLVGHLSVFCFPFILTALYCEKGKTCFIGVRKLKFVLGGFLAGIYWNGYASTLIWSLLCDTSVSLWWRLTMASPLDTPVRLCSTIILSGSIRNCLLAWIWKLKFPKEKCILHLLPWVFYSMWYFIFPSEFLFCSWEQVNVQWQFLSVCLLEHNHGF